MLDIGSVNFVAIDCEGLDVDLLRATGSSDDQWFFRVWEAQCDLVEYGPGNVD